MRKRGVFMAKGSYRLTGAHQERRGLNWCGQPIQEGEGYGGREENIPARETVGSSHRRTPYFVL
jgi:hypothetical protein